MEVLDDSEATRLQELLDSNGFTVLSMDVRGYKGAVTEIQVTVLPEPQ